MDTSQAIIAFTATATALTITPGIDTAMVLRTAATGGARPAAFATLGIGLGCLAWGTVAALGLGALLSASELAYQILKLAGAAYLLWLGARLILSPRDGFDAGGGQGEVAGMLAFRRGFLSNVLNPKVGVFYVTFLPQFVPSGGDVALFSLLLAGIHVLLGLAWSAMLIAAAVPFGKALSRPAVVRVLDRVTGGIFIAFGLRLALSRQT